MIESALVMAVYLFGLLFTLRALLRQRKPFHLVIVAVDNSSPALRRMADEIAAIDPATASLATPAPFSVDLIASLPRAGHREAECHKRLSHLRVHGEWFRYTEEVDALIEDLS